METPVSEFNVSVVIGSGYEASAVKSWKVGERMLRAFAAQTCDELFEVLHSHKKESQK